MVDVDVTLSPVTDADGAVVGASAIARDISQLVAILADGGEAAGSPASPEPEEATGGFFAKLFGSKK